MKRRDRDIKEDAKRTIIEFIIDLRTGIFSNPSEQLELVFVEAYYTKKDPEEAIHHLVSHVLPYREHITKRNLQFFVEKKDDIFRGLPQARIDHFAMLVATPSELGGLDEENKGIIWEYFDVFISLAEEYKKKC
jgi:hypothetical protein